MVYSLIEYQRSAVATAIYPGKFGVLGKVYCALKLNGEAGELAEHIGKALRDDDQNFTEERKERIKKELGDVLWYIANLSAEFGWSLDHVAAINLEKLASRKERGTLQGSGDDR